MVVDEGVSLRFVSGPHSSSRHAVHSSNVDLNLANVPLHVAVGIPLLYGNKLAANVMLDPADFNIEAEVAVPEVHFVEIIPGHIQFKSRAQFVHMSMRL